MIFSTGIGLGHTAEIGISDIVWQSKFKYKNEDQAKKNYINS